MFQHKRFAIAVGFLQFFKIFLDKNFQKEQGLFCRSEVLFLQPWQIKLQNQKSNINITYP
jgi:hypothetical protein